MFNTKVDIDVRHVFHNLSHLYFRLFALCLLPGVQVTSATLQV